MESVGTNKLKKKLSVPAGKSVNIEDLEKINKGYDIAPKNLAMRKKQILNMNIIKSKVKSEDPKECHDHNSVSKAFSNKKKSEKSSSKNWTSVQREGEFVVFGYEDELFPGEIRIVKENRVYVKSMVKTLKEWKWSEIQEDNFYEWSNILFHIKEPQKISKTRELYKVL